MKSSWTARGVIALLFLVTTGGSAYAQQGPLRELDAYIEKNLAAWEVPGLAISVIKDDAIIFSKGYGVRRLGSTDMVDERTVFAIGSNSKTFTSAGIAMLIDDGLVKWDDKVTDHLPTFQTSDSYVTRELTIRDLLTHRSGLSRDDNSWLGQTTSRHELVRRVRFLGKQESFRSEFGYHNFMFLTAGAVIEEISGHTWDEFVKQRMLVPLGMKMSNTSINDLRYLDNVASPHANIDGRIVPVEWRNIDNMAAAGSINSNVVDMAQWVRLMLASGKSGEEQLISAGAVKEMHTPQMVIRREGFWGMMSPASHLLAYGLGWFLLDYRDRMVVLHGGNIDGMSALMLLVPEENLGTVILTNMNQSIAHIGFAYRLIDLMLGDATRDWSSEFLAIFRAGEEQSAQQLEKREESRVRGTSPSLALAAYAGTYVDPDSLYGTAEVSYQDGHLVMRNGQAFVGDLEHWHYDTFRATFRDRIRGGGLVRFTLDAAGKVAEMNVTGLADFVRVPEGG